MSLESIDFVTARRQVLFGGAALVATSLVPASALVTRSEVTAVYVVGEDNRVALRQVRLGHRRDGEVEVLAGLAEGERIAADPLDALAHLAGATEAGND